MCQRIIKGNKKIQLRYYEDKLKSKSSISLVKFLKKAKNTRFFLS